jgi:hypothetical protein
MAQARAENEQRARASRRRASRSTSAQSRARGNGRPADAPRSGARPGGDVEQPSSTLQQVAQKAKSPAIAGGAAAAAAAAIAGGVAIARNGAKKGKGPSLPGLGRRARGRISMPHISAPHISRPHLPKPANGETKDALRAAAKALGGVAVEVGKTGYRVGELATEVRRVREQASRES